MMMPDVHHDQPFWHVSGSPRVWTTNRQGGRDPERRPQLAPGESVVLADLEGPALIDYCWLTFDWPGTDDYPRAEERSERVWIEVTWDDATQPAVSAPVGDFFGHLLGRSIPFENAWFANPVGRSCICHLPMPFRRKARIEIHNRFDTTIDVYYDIRSRAIPASDADAAGYCHAHWSRTASVEPDTGHEVLPTVRGRGRYIGTHAAIRSCLPPELEWHAGSLTMQLDAQPPLVTATLDDYCGSAWAHDRPYIQSDSGLLFSDHSPTGGVHGFYCYHRRDPVWFDAGCRVHLEARGGMRARDWRTLLAAQPAVAESVHLPIDQEALSALAQSEPDSWIIADRRDTLTTVALFYLETP